MSNTGRVVWAFKYGIAAGNDFGRSVVVTQDGSSLYICGFYESTTIGFGNVTLVSGIAGLRKTESATYAC